MNKKRWLMMVTMNVTLGTVTTAKTVMSEGKVTFKADEGSMEVWKNRSVFVKHWKRGAVGRLATIACSVGALLLSCLVFGGCGKSDSESGGEAEASVSKDVSVAKGTSAAKDVPASKGSSASKGTAAAKKRSVPKDTLVVKGLYMGMPGDDAVEACKEMVASSKDLGVVDLRNGIECKKDEAMMATEKQAYEKAVKLAETDVDKFLTWQNQQGGMYDSTYVPQANALGGRKADGYAKYAESDKDDLFGNKQAAVLFKPSLPAVKSTKTIDSDRTLDALSKLAEMYGYQVEWLLLGQQRAKLCTVGSFVIPDPQKGQGISNKQSVLQNGYSKLNAQPIALVKHGKLRTQPISKKDYSKLRVQFNLQKGQGNSSTQSTLQKVFGNSGTQPQKREGDSNAQSILQKRLDKLRVQPTPPKGQNNPSTQPTSPKGLGNSNTQSIPPKTQGSSSTQSTPQKVQGKSSTQSTSQKVQSKPSVQSTPPKGQSQSIAPLTGREYHDKYWGNTSFLGVWNNRYSRVDGKDTNTEEYAKAHLATQGLELAELGFFNERVWFRLTLNDVKGNPVTKDWVIEEFLRLKPKFEVGGTISSAQEKELAKKYVDVFLGWMKFDDRNAIALSESDAGDNTSPGGEVNRSSQRGGRNRSGNSNQNVRSIGAKIWRLNDQEVMLILAEKCQLKVEWGVFAKPIKLVEVSEPLAVPDGKVSVAVNELSGSLAPSLGSSGPKKRIELFQDKGFDDASGYPFFRLVLKTTNGVEVAKEEVVKNWLAARGHYPPNDTLKLAKKNVITIAVKKEAMSEPRFLQAVAEKSGDCPSRCNVWIDDQDKVKEVYFNESGMAKFFNAGDLSSEEFVHLLVKNYSGIPSLEPEVKKEDPGRGMIQTTIWTHKDPRGYQVKLFDRVYFNNNGVKYTSQMLERDPEVAFGLSLADKLPMRYFAITAIIPESARQFD